jgi:hypothetical protein
MWFRECRVEGVERAAEVTRPPTSNILPRALFSSGERTVGVSSRNMATSPAANPGERLPPSLVACVALLPPRVPVDVITKGLPEAGLIRPHEDETAHPLCTLPEIEMRHQ